MNRICYAFIFDIMANRARNKYEGPPQQTFHFFCTKALLLITTQYAQKLTL